MKKSLSLLLALLLIAVLLVGCGGQSAPAEAQASNTTEAKTPETTEAQNTEPEGIFVTVNGVDVTVGVPFADLEEALGAQTAPAETMYACDPDSDWQQTLHYYDGVIVTEDKDGVIDGVQVSEGDAALMGKIRVGATRDEAVALLGEPDDEDAWALYYNNLTPMVYFYLDDATGLISGFALMGAD